MAFLPRRRTEERSPVGTPGAMQRWFKDFLGGMEMPAFGAEMAFAPAVDVVETPASIVVKAEVPGVDPKQMEISITGDALTIRGEKKAEKEEKGKNYHRIERSCGSFSRTITLPSYADGEKVSADYKDGVLTVTLGKKEEAKPKNVNVQFK